MSIKLPRQATTKLNISGAELPRTFKPKQNYHALSKEFDELVGRGEVNACEVVLSRLVESSREAVKLSQTLQKLSRIRNPALRTIVSIYSDKILDRLNRTNLSHIPTRTACTILRTVGDLPNSALSSQIVETIHRDLNSGTSSILLNSASPLDISMLLNFFIVRTGHKDTIINNLLDRLRMRVAELDNASYPIALSSLRKISFGRSIREAMLNRLHDLIPSMSAAQLAQTHEGLQEIGALDGENGERILTAFLSLGGAPQARDWTRLMISVARGQASELPYLLECVHSVISDGDWRGSELVEILHCMAITSYKDTHILKILGKELRPKILAERSTNQQLKLSTAAITYMSAIRTMLVTMEELLNDVTKLLRTEVATSIQIHQILSALVRQDDKLITRPSRGGYRDLIALCEDQWCKLAITEGLSERAFLSTTVLFADVARGALTDRLSSLVLNWAAEDSRISHLNVLDAIQFTGLLSKICNSNDVGDTEKAADLIDAVYDRASHELNLRDWPPSEFSVFVSNLAAAGDCGLYDAEGLSHTISLHVQRRGHNYDCRHVTLVTEALSKLSNRVQDVNSLGPLWHEVSEKLLVFQAKQLLSIGVAMSKFTAESVTAIQYRNFPTLTGAFLKDANLLSSLDTCSRVDLIASWSRVGGLTGTLLEAVATGITDNVTFKNPVRDASRVLFSLYCVNLHSLSRNTGPNTQALVRHCRNALEIEAPFSRSVAPEDLVRVIVSLSASSVLSASPSSSCRTDLIAYSALETLLKIHYKWLVQFLEERGPSRSMFVMTLTWLSPIRMIERDEVVTDSLIKSRLLDILHQLNINNNEKKPPSLNSGARSADEQLTMEEQSIYRRLGTKGLAMVSSPPFTIRLATTEMVAIEILSDREVLGQREDLVAWTKIRLSLLLNRGWKIALIRPSERKGLVNADSLYELALNKLQIIDVT